MLGASTPTMVAGGGVHLIIAADATQVISPTPSRLASTTRGFVQQPGRVAPLNS